MCVAAAAKLGRPAGDSSVSLASLAVRCNYLLATTSAGGALPLTSHRSRAVKLNFPVLGKSVITGY